MNLSSAILATLAYHDIFDYPLDFSEIYDLLIQKKAQKTFVAGELDRLVDIGKVGKSNGYFFLRNSQKIVGIRKMRINYSHKKFKKSALFANLLKVIPSVKLVAVSGAL